MAEGNAGTTSEEGDVIMTFGGGGSPDPPPIVEKKPPPEPEIDEAELARQRADIERKRKGRSSLVINPNPSVSTLGNFAGLRVPTKSA